MNSEALVQKYSDLFERLCDYEDVENFDAAEDEETKNGSGKFLTGKFAKVPIEFYAKIFDCLKKLRWYYPVVEFKRLLHIKEYMDLKGIDTKEVDVDIVACFKYQAKYLFSENFTNYFKEKDNCFKDGESTKEVNADIYKYINEVERSERNNKLYSKLIGWTDSEPNIHTDWHNYRRTLYYCLKNIILDMEISGVENDDDTYKVYSNSGSFKWYLNEYTIYVNGRDPKKDEKPNSLANQLNTIVNAVKNNGRDKDSKLNPGEKEWEGTLVGDGVAVDISIIWDRNTWQSTAHLPAQGKFMGRLVYHSDVYAAVYSSMLTAINTGRDVKGSTKAAVEEYFTGQNTLGFMDRVQNSIIDDLAK